MSKNSQVISYRLSEEEVEALRQYQRSEESLNQAAQRLLREALKLSTASTTTSTASLSTLSTVDVDSRITVQLAPLQEKIAQLETALGEFAA